MSRSAVFLDRDGTIIRDYHFIDRPWLVDLIPGAAQAVKRFGQALADDPDRRRFVSKLKERMSTI